MLPQLLIYSQALISHVGDKEHVEEALGLSIYPTTLISFSTFAVVVEEGWLFNSILSYAAMSNVQCKRGASCLFSVSSFLFPPFALLLAPPFFLHPPKLPLFLLSFPLTLLPSLSLLFLLLLFLTFSCMIP